MTQYIDKDDVMAEIERLRERFISFHHRGCIDFLFDNYGKLRAYNEILSFIDTLEVKEVDLETEIDRWLGREAFPEGVGVTPLPKALEIAERTAKHFFELGLKAHKGE